MSHNKNTPINILLADDDTDDCIFFEKALAGVSVATHLTTVRDGEQLMQYLAGNPGCQPDIIFLDLSMPRKTGFECLMEIKEDKTLKDIPVVVFTTSFGRDIHFEQSLINTLTNIGSQEYVRKPSDITELQQIIQKALTTVFENQVKKEH
jgi:CheY-like chemotaxis protein